MSANFDIFMRLPDGHPWIKAVETLDEARHLLRPLAMSFPEDYFIFDNQSGPGNCRLGIDRAVLRGSSD
jgi:hypothetical protein